ncbi:glutathione S-transferase 3-like [Pelobates fuscus]|uniref:glutathione S-transferase 3-like n=1 Tax=Pelobates fuscus TaxID=191477 RepID=UPI002FE45969
MAQKPKLYYFNGRGKMESVRWLLAAADVEFDEVFLETKEQYKKLLEDGSLLFQQVPMVEMDGMKIVQSRAILNYIATKYNLYGKDIKDRLFIDMYVEGTIDLMTIISGLYIQPEDTKIKQKDLIKNRALNRYFPVYEKALQGQDFLVGKQLSIADVQLLEAILMVEEVHNDVLSHFPRLQAFKKQTSEIPTIKKFLQPGSKRKPIPDEKLIAAAKEILYS